MKKGDIVLIDCGVVLDHYASDMTRTFFFGKGNKELHTMYNTVYRAQKRALSVCKAGVHIRELDLAARKEMKKDGLEKYYPHSLGHGVGLEVHEEPRVSFRGDGVLEEGMVITIEPGLYKPGLGGIRYEDTISITKNGYDNFFPEIDLSFIAEYLTPTNECYTRP